MVEIREQSGISSSQASMFFPKERFYIPKSTIQRTKSVITSLNSGIVTSDFKNTASTPYDFVLTANNMSVFDLSQFYFNIAGELGFESAADVPIDNEELMFGNLFITSLFQNATLEIGGAVVALNTNPGIDANAQAILKFDQYDLKEYALADREFMINSTTERIAKSTSVINFGADTFKFVNHAADVGGYYPEGKTVKDLPQYAGKTYIYYGTSIALTAAINSVAFKITFSDSGAGVLKSYQKITAAIVDAPNVTGLNANITYDVLSADDYVININKNCVIPSVNDSGFQKVGGKYKIPFRCKLYLSDLFNYTVDSLDYIFNRDIKITLTRSSISNIICNLFHIGSTMSSKVDVISTSKFELIAYSYLLTDTARNELIKFYSRPIETLYGVQTVNLTPLYQDAANNEQNITLPLTVNYDTKAIILAFPKCSNCLVPLSNKSTTAVDGPIDNTNAENYQYNWMYSNCNSYNYAGLKYIRISNTNNQSIATYDFSGTAEKFTNMEPLLKSFDFTNVSINNEGTNNDYREIYEQMKELRLLFGKSPDNAIDYYTFLKDYFIIPIDLTGSNIPPNTRIFITFQFDNFQNGYNPLYYGNNSLNNKKLTTNLLAIYFGRDVLTYNPDGTCIVKHVLSANPTEKGVNLM